MRNRGQTLYGATEFLTYSLEVKSLFLIEADNQRVSHVPSVQGVLEYVKAYSGHAQEV